MKNKLDERLVYFGLLLPIFFLIWSTTDLNAQSTEQTQQSNPKSITFTTVRLNLTEENASTTYIEDETINGTNDQLKAAFNRILESGDYLGKHPANETIIFVDSVSKSSKMVTGDTVTKDDYVKWFDSVLLSMDHDGDVYRKKSWVTTTTTACDDTHCETTTSSAHY